MIYARIYASKGKLKIIFLKEDNYKIYPLTLPRSKLIELKEKIKTDKVVDVTLKLEDITTYNGKVRLLNFQYDWLDFKFKNDIEYNRKEYY